MRQKIFPAATLYVLMTCGLFLVVSGCAQYQESALKDPQFEKIFIAPVDNRTDIPELTQQLRSAVESRIMREGMATVTTREDADTILSLHVRNYSLSEAGGARVREDIYTEDDEDEYQTTVYQAQVKTEMRLLQPENGDGAPASDGEEISGQARFTRLPDMAKTQRAGLRQACINAAKKIAAKLTEPGS